MRESTVASLLQRLAASRLDRVLICIDGPAGSGKTTLAEQLAQSLAAAEVIHMDDLYEGWDSPLDQRLTRRLIGIRDPWLAGSAVEYQKYDWYQSQFAEHVRIESAQALIVEGVGAAQSCMRVAAALTVFIDIEPAIGLGRVFERDGVLVGEHMADWQQAEQRHFELDATRESVHVRLDGERD